MTFVLIPGAGCTPWHWRPLTAELTRRGHDVVPVEIPWQDPEAGLTQYVDAVVEVSGGGMAEPWPLERFPAVPTWAVIGREDRFFPADFLRRMTVERLGLVAEEMPGAHFPMLGHPVELADRLENYLRAEPTGP